MTCDKKSKRGINISEWCIRPAAWRRCCEFVIRRANTMGCNHCTSVTWVVCAARQRGFARSQTRTRVYLYATSVTGRRLISSRGETLFSSIAISSPLFLFHRVLNYFALFLPAGKIFTTRRIFTVAGLFRFGCDSLLWGRMRDVPGKATFLARTLLPGGLRPTCETNGRPPLHLPLWSSTICHAALY
jgi:hypothetical protein